MSSRLMQVLLALSLLLNTFVLAGFVYRSWIEPPAVRASRRRRRRGSVPARWRRWRTISTSMMGSARRCALCSSSIPTTRRERQREIQKVREQIAAEYKHPTIDMARIDTLIDQLTKLRADQQKEYLGSLNQLAAQLKPEQRDRMHQILAERLAMPFGPRPPGGGAGGRVPARPPQ